MTKEEAIKQLDGADIAVLNRDFFKFNQAIIMAINALRHEPVTNRNELNEPLTLDELREMDGEPVWVVCLTPELYYDAPVGWRILEKSIIGTFGVWKNNSCFTERDYGKTWMAYRQKTEDGTV